MFIYLGRFMKLCFFAVFLLACSASFALQTVTVGSTFSCDFLDQGDTHFGETSTATWTQDQIDAAVRALSTWDSLIANTPGRTLTVGLSWYNESNNTLANASSPFRYYYTNNAQQVSTFAEDIWKNGNNAGGSPSSHYDIVIHCNTYQANQFYFGADILPSSINQYDFQSILTHEVGHAVGFLSLATETGSFRTENVTDSNNRSYSTMLYTAYDKLMTNKEGQKLVNLASANPNTAVFQLGDTVALDGTELTVYNPATWQNGSSMAHIDSESDPDALMQYSISKDTYRRTLTDGEIQLMSAMGWNMVPEPSTVTLSLFALGMLVGRRRRSAA